jgi:hypothetical protein
MTPAETPAGGLSPETAERWARIDRALDAALELPRGERAAFVAQACAGDDSLRGEVERLLEACEAAESDRSFLSEPAAEHAAPVL